MLTLSFPFYSWKITHKYYSKKYCTTPQDFLKFGTSFILKPKSILKYVPRKRNFLLLGHDIVVFLVRQRSHQAKVADFHLLIKERVVINIINLLLQIVHYFYLTINIHFIAFPVLECLK